MAREEWGKEDSIKGREIREKREEREKGEMLPWIGYVGVYDSDQQRSTVS